MIFWRGCCARYCPARMRITVTGRSWLRNSLDRSHTQVHGALPIKGTRYNNSSSRLVNLILMLCSEKRCCPACTASSPKVVGFKNEFEVLACKSCFTLYTSSLPEGEDAEDYDQYYSESNLSVPGFVVD